MRSECVLSCLYFVFFLIFSVKSESEKFQACTVGRIDCSDSYPSIHTIRLLKKYYGKCRYIIGNLVICDVNRLANGSDPDLSFLETIEEVSGYVYISRNSVKRIPLKSLRIVRGESFYRVGENKGSFLVTRNFHKNDSLEIIDLRNLIAIQKHNVIVKDNPLLCNFAATVSWDDLFPEPENQRYIPDRTSTSISQRGCNMSRETDAQIFSSCDGACTMVNSQGYCWGPGPELCQKMLKCRNDPQHYCVDGPISSEVCSEECLGGCENTPNNCRACRHVRNNGRCMSQCPPLYINVYQRLVLNPDFKYTFFYECVEDCPAPFLKSKSYCVIECDLNTETAINGTCVPCKPPGCPQHCTQDYIFENTKRFILDAGALERIKNCSHYTGLLYLNSESFKEKSPFTRTPIRDLSALWNMRNLQAIVGRVYFDLRDTPPEITNLTFLQNVRSLVYETRRSFSSYALQIMNGDHVEMLGFRSLKSVHGKVRFDNMTKLCYLDALEKIVVINKTNVPSQEQCDKRGALCNSECLPAVGCWGPGANMCGHCCNLQAGDVCVSQCTDLPGFYEIPDESSSVRRPPYTASHPYCLTLPLSESQTHDVDDAYLRFARRPAKLCARCHVECAETCYGPDDNQCKGRCKHFQHGDRCVATCPLETYVDSNTMSCLPCSDVCRPSYPMDFRMCSGPGSFLGYGGCTLCSTVIQNLTTKAYECLSEDCPTQHYKESHKLVEFARREKINLTEETESRARELINVCRPCHPYCSMCTANGTHKPICHECLFWWFRDECVRECPPSETYTLPPSTTVTVVSQQPTTPGGLSGTTSSRTIEADTQTTSGPEGEDVEQKYCLLCHEECVQGCTGPGPEDCHKCRNYKIMLDTEGENFVCSSSCPEDRSYILHSMCLTADQYAKLSGRGARELRDRILIAVAVLIIFLISFTAVLLFVCLKRRAETERIREKLFFAYTNLDADDRESLLKNQSSIREPNMGRLEMISTDELDYDSSATPLGSGAFGVVYRGVWRLSKSALLKHGCRGTHKFDVAIKVIQNDYPITPNLTGHEQAANGGLRDAEQDAWRATARANIEELLEEAKVMASVEHQHCLPLIGVCLTRERHCLVTMFLELGSLDRYVKEHRDELSSLILLMWAEQIADGMNYLEMRGIIHRDLAARNVLVQRQDLVQITDFGLAKMLDRRDQDSVIVRAGRVPIRWLAIETLQDSVYSHKTDVWAYGVTLWEIFTYGKRPYEDVETTDIKDHVMKGGRLTQPDICTLDVYMVMVKCWMEDFESRPTFAELTRTFNNFCKTPGRYLYIQGDEYAINYPNLGTFSPSSSNEAHELRPLLTPRGVPDGSVSNRLNDSFDRKTLGTPGSNGRFSSPQFVGQNVRSDYLSAAPDEFRQFDSGDEPVETEALLPVRDAGPSIWPSRPRSHGVGAPEHTPGQAPQQNFPRPPPSENENLCLAQAPVSPNWRTTTKPVVTTAHSPDPGNRLLDNATTPVTKASPWAGDGYLEPKPSLTPTPTKTTATDKLHTPVVAGPDYLIPRKPPNQQFQPPRGNAIAVSNMGYCQPDNEIPSDGQPTSVDAEQNI